MTEGETTRLTAWGRELRQVHDRLRAALRVSEQALADRHAGDAATTDLLLYCRGFCTALDGHHQGEDRALFPAVAAAHPELAPVLASLQQDHSMIAHLLTGLDEAVRLAAPVAQIRTHLDGLSAVMESHFRYEERQLLLVLETLDLDQSVHDVLGPL